MTKLSEDPLIHEPVYIEGSELGRYTEVGAHSTVQFTTFGDYSYCSPHCDIANATIGKFANIASHVRIGATDHPMDRASMHHFLYRSGDYWEDAEKDHAFFERRRARRINIGHDTWFGYNSYVAPEVTIGHGSVVAAMAVVTKDVPNYTIVAGVPAKPVRRRFSEEVEARLLALAWWDWDHQRLRAALPDFRDLPIEAFLETYGET